jgi:hypothetical protein
MSAPHFAAPVIASSAGVPNMIKKDAPTRNTARP